MSSNHSSSGSPASSANSTGAGIEVERCNEDDPLAPLGHPREAGVDEPVGPAIAERLEFVDEVAHRLAAVEHEHVAHVLEHQHRRPAALQEPEHLADETRRPRR